MCFEHVFQSRANIEEREYCWMLLSVSCCQGKNCLFPQMEVLKLEEALESSGHYSPADIAERAKKYREKLLQVSPLPSFSILNIFPLAIKLCLHFSFLSYASRTLLQNHTVKKLLRMMKEILVPQRRKAGVSMTTQKHPRNERKKKVPMQKKVEAQRRTKGEEKIHRHQESLRSTLAGLALAQRCMQSRIHAVLFW